MGEGVSRNKDKKNYSKHDKFEVFIRSDGSRVSLCWEIISVCKTKHSFVDRFVMNTTMKSSKHLTSPDKWMRGCGRGMVQEAKANVDHPQQKLLCAPSTDAFATSFFCFFFQTDKSECESSK